MALFPPGKGGGQGVAHGYKGKGVTIHSVVAGKGMPLGVLSAAANVSELRMVKPLLKTIRVHGRDAAKPRTSLRALAFERAMTIRNCA